MNMLATENARLHDELAVLEAKAKEDFEKARLNERLAHDCNCTLSAEVQLLRKRVDILEGKMYMLYDKNKTP